jgi:cephalosporin hydroxylase/ubiquinone/menaquinone biosynthesis C-methylase UbiE
MKLTIDTASGVLSLDDGGESRNFPLYSREAFEFISREWVRVGWAANYYFTLSWFGRPILQLPEDLVRLQEVVYRLRPDVIVECGIYSGGSMLFHATLCEAMGKGRVIGIDQHIPEDTLEAVTSHRLSRRIEMIEGNSVSPEVVDKVRSRIKPGETVLVILDSNHTKEHVAGELNAYSPLVTPGSCIVAADGIMRELTDVPGGDPSWAHDNPAEAALEFAEAHPEFELRQPEWPFNRSELRQNITYWPDAWLCRKTEAAPAGKLTAGEIREGIERLGPWFYRFDFGNGLATTPAIPASVVDIFETRLRMVESTVNAHFGARLREIECLDIGCHEGFYSLAMAPRVRNVVAVDARAENLNRARFVARALGVTNIEFGEGRVETVSTDQGRKFPLTLFLGLLYHVEDPMRCLREVAAVTGELCVIETQVVDEVEGYAEWGSREWTRPYQGILAVIDETGEFDAGNRETGVSPMATCPSPRALIYMLKQAGFRHAQILEPPTDAYEQHARGKRVVCAAYK